MQKIDFFGGLHGHFLELVVNTAINQNGYDLGLEQFTATGACHLKNQDPGYQAHAQALHYSYFGRPFDAGDQVIRIVPTAADLLIGLTNSFTRAGDNSIDIDQLEINTLHKLSESAKGNNFVATIQAEHGTHVNYPRSVVRNYFYSMLSDSALCLDPFTQFDTAPVQVYEFPFRAFFEQGYFYQQLNAIAGFLGLNFYPTPELGRVYQQFIQLNQGYHSELRCQQVWQAVLNCESLPIKLNLIEEAWINWQAAECFRCYDLAVLNQDSYPVNTLQIADAIFAWKAQDR